MHLIKMNVFWNSDINFTIFNIFSSEKSNKISWKEPNKVIGVDFIYYGHQGANDGKEYSAMAQTVGYPAAIAAHLVLNETIATTGMLTPLTKDIYEPILAQLKELGIQARRTESSVWKNNKNISDQRNIYFWYMCLAC